MVFVVSFSSCLDVAAISMDMGEALDTNSELMTVGISNCKYLKLRRLMQQALIDIFCFHFFHQLFLEFSEDSRGRTSSLKPFSRIGQAVARDGLGCW